MSELHDDTCANCGHGSESHHAGIGRCYRCPAVARCMRFVTRESTAAQAAVDEKGAR